MLCSNQIIQMKHDIKLYVIKYHIIHNMLYCFPLMDYLIKKVEFISVCLYYYCWWYRTYEQQKKTILLIIAFDLKLVFTYKLRSLR